MISIIVPAYDEAETLPDWLSVLFSEHAVGECVVVDASEHKAFTRTATRLDAAISKPYLRYVAATEKGRARQMNQGAELSEGAILLFLHADTLLPEAALAQIRRAIEAGAHWGRFDVSFDNPGRAFKMIAAMMNGRSRQTGIATGDQAIFVTRGAFDLVGGFDDIDLMEDIALCKKLKVIGPPACLKSTVTTSARRWEQKGIFRTIALMWGMRLAYWLGVSPARLATWYR